MQLRQAVPGDIHAIERLIARSVMGVMGPEYTEDQKRASIGPLFGVDRQVVDDGTYYVVERDGEVVGSGGWSFRRVLFGGDAVGERDDSRADPAVDAAHIRAYYVDPSATRSGIGTRILRASEAAARERGFTRFELGATLTGLPFYARYGYTRGEPIDFELPGGLIFPLVNMRKEDPAPGHR